MLSSSLLTGTDVLEQQLVARSYLCTLEPAMQVESGTVPLSMVLQERRWLR